VNRGPTGGESGGGTGCTSGHVATLTSLYTLHARQCKRNQFVKYLCVNPEQSELPAHPDLPSACDTRRALLTLLGTIAVLLLLVGISAAISARLLACLIVALALGVRLDLYATGSLYGSADLWAADIITAVLIFLAMIVFLAFPPNQSQGGAASWERRLATVGVVVAVPVGLVGVVQLAAPSSPRTATAPACAGAPVAGGAFLATTPATGLNARSGPDTTYPQVQRFAANCTLSFDGYCIGEPVSDLLITNYPDQRWLILHRPWQSWPWENMPWGKPSYAFVAAGQVQSQSAESELGTRPAQTCGRLGGWKPPTPIALKTRLSHGVVSIRASSERAEIIGLSILSDHPLKDGTDAVVALTEPAELTHEAGTITATWNVEAVTVPAVGQPATFTLLASACLGPAVADLEGYATRAFTWNGKSLSESPSEPGSLTQAQLLHLQTAACHVAPPKPSP
jgi:hypothetical protein